MRALRAITTALREPAQMSRRLYGSSDLICEAISILRAARYTARQAAPCHAGAGQRRLGRRRPNCRAPCGSACRRIRILRGPLSVAALNHNYRNVFGGADKRNTVNLLCSTDPWRRIVFVRGARELGGRAPQQHALRWSRRRVRGATPLMGPERCQPLSIDLCRR